MRLPGIVSFAALLLACAAGCDAAEDKKPAAAPANAPAAPQPGFAAGRILGADGKPIAVDGIKAQVAVYGISEAGQNVKYFPPVAADGTWKAKLVPGTYHAPKATLAVPFDKKAFTYDLVPDADGGDFAAADGIVRDFTWRPSGPKPSELNPDPNTPHHWFGAHSPLTYQQFPNGPKQKGLGPLGPKGTRLVFTATPVGKLIDGTDGKPLAFDLEYDAVLSRARPNYLHDLPVAKYTVTAKMVAPGGAEQPLILQMQTSGDPKPFGPSIEVEYAHIRGGGMASSLTIYYSRQP